MFLSLPDILFPSAKTVFWCIELKYTPNLELTDCRKGSLYANSGLEGLCFKQQLRMENEQHGCNGGKAGALLIDPTSTPQVR